MLVEQNHIYYYITFRLYLVRVILGGMEKEMRKVERKWYFGVFSWWRKLAGKLVGPGCFFAGPTRMQSPQFGRKLERKRRTKSSAWERPNYHVQHSHSLSFCHFLLLFWPRVSSFLLSFSVTFYSFWVFICFFFPHLFWFFFPQSVLFFLSCFGFLYSFLFIFLYNEIHIHT